jgi:hypothetical protein
MASEVTICNLALGHIGDSATVSSLNPPEGSAQAEHCARYYPEARNALLEMHAWNFATRRASLAQVSNPSSTWLYAYAMPSGCLKVLAVIPAGATDDYVFSVHDEDTGALVAGGGYTPQPYTVETDENGNRIILTNCANAVLRFTALVTDTTRFSPLFTQALTWLLASMLAGPIIKGDT